MQLSNKQQVQLSVEFRDANNVIVPVTGSPVWTSSDISIATVVPTADGLSASVLSVDNAVGSSTILVTLGTLSDSLVVDVSNDGGVGTATSAKIIVGAVTNK